MSGWDAYIAALLGDKSVMTGAAIYGQSGQPDVTHLNTIDFHVRCSFHTPVLVCVPVSLVTVTSQAHANPQPCLASQLQHTTCTYATIMPLVLSLS